MKEVLEYKNLQPDDMLQYKPSFSRQHNHKTRLG